MTGTDRAVEMATALVRRYEGLRLQAYADPAGKWTIGYGWTGPVRGRPLGPGVTITRQEAEELLRSELRRLARAITDMLARPANPHQLAAMVSLAYNIGLGAFRKSTLLRAWNEGDADRAALEFTRWVHAGGKILPGLVRRRVHEALVFAGAVEVEV